MLWFILAFIATIIAIIIETKILKYHKDNIRLIIKNFFEWFGVFTIFGIMLGVITSALATNFYNAPIIYELYKSNELVTIENENINETKNYLLIGYTDDSYCRFKYAIETEDGYTEKTIYPDGCIVKYDSENPRIEYLKPFYKDKLLKLFTFHTMKFDKIIIWCPEGADFVEFE